MKHSPWLPYLGLTLTVLFWSGNFILGRGIRELIPPVTFARDQIGEMAGVVPLRKKES